MERGYKPGMESLEVRDCPAVLFNTNEGGRVLSITGGNENDVVFIRQDDVNGLLHVDFNVTPAPGTVAPAVMQSQTFNSTTISKILINLGRGNDTVMYNSSGGSRLTSFKNILVNMGTGNDTFDFQSGTFINYSHGDEPHATDSIEGPVSIPIWPGPQPNFSTHAANFTLTVDMGAGQDNANVSLGHIATDAIVDIKLRMGQGNDFAQYTGLGSIADNARLKLMIDGESGNDTLYATQIGNLSPTSVLYFNILGGSGADVIRTFLTLSNPAQGSVTLLSSGGSGHDFLITRLDGGVATTPIVRMNGDAGKDELCFCSSSDYTGAVINGGLGMDKARVDKLTYSFAGMESIVLDNFPVI